MARLINGEPVELGRLTLADVAAAASLSAIIGWNQDEADWRRLVEVHPEGAVAARLAGKLVGTATLVRYPAAAVGSAAGSATGSATGSAVGSATGSATGSAVGSAVGSAIDSAAGRVTGSSPGGLTGLAWLGMVIAHPDVRGQGVGAAVTDAALALWHGPEGSVIGLDATEFGAPIYRRRGFETVATIDRWAGQLEPGGVDSGGQNGLRIGLAGAADLAEVFALDRRETGVDRSALLDHLAAEEQGRLVVARDGDALVGYLGLRSGRHYRHMGPLVAQGSAVATRLLDFTAPLAQGAPVFLDSVSGMLPSESLIGRGLSVVRTLQRMARPARPVFERKTVMAAFDFAWG